MSSEHSPACGPEFTVWARDPDWIGYRLDAFSRRDAVGTVHLAVEDDHPFAERLVRIINRRLSLVRWPRPTFVSVDVWQVSEDGDE